MTVLSVPGEIRPEVLYTLPAAKLLTGWGAAAFRRARREGLNVRYSGRNAFVKGADLIRHIEQHGRDEK